MQGTSLPVSPETFLLTLTAPESILVTMMKQTQLDVTSVVWYLTEILDVAQSNDDVICPRSYLSDGTRYRLDELEATGYVIFYSNPVTQQRNFVGLTTKGEELLTYAPMLKPKYLVEE